MATGVVWRVRYTNRQKMALYCTLYYQLAKDVAMRRGRSGREAESEKLSGRSGRSRHNFRSHHRHLLPPKGIDDPGSRAQYGVPAQGKECFSTRRAGSAMDQSRSPPTLEDYL